MSNDSRMAVRKKFKLFIIYSFEARDLEFKNNIYQ